MVVSASTAQGLVTNSVAQNNANLVQQQAALADAAIRNAAALGVYTVLFNATLIGNPVGNPQISTNLTNANQVTFLNLYNGAGFSVGWDQATGYWEFSWEISGIETQVAVYTLRTTVAPGSLSTQTIAAIEGYFSSQVPVSYVNVQLGPDGGTIPEASFGLSAPTFYEYTMVVNQGNGQTTDNSAGIKAAVIATALGYTTSNTAVFKMI